MDELLDHWVIYRCVTGSRAYGLDEEDSDPDVRGVFVAPPDLLWSLQGAPDYLEQGAMDEAYWEIRKFCVLALKANPNVLECLYTPIVLASTPLGEELLTLRDAFLSRLVHQTYNGYVLSQFKKLERDLRSRASPNGSTSCTSSGCCSPASRCSRPEQWRSGSSTIEIACSIFVGGRWHGRKWRLETPTPPSI